MQPSFELDNYEIVSCSYRRNDVSGEVRGSIGFKQLIQRLEDNPDKYRVQITTIVSGIADIELVVAGYFTSTGLLDEDEVDSAIQFSGMYILLPFIRSYIQTVSCQDGRQPVTIPIINVGDLLSSNGDT